MVHMIIVFPKKEIGVNIRNILSHSGLEAAGVYTTGAQALQCADTMDEGIVICGYRMRDMMYSELRECLPEAFEMLLISSPDKWSDGLEDGVVGLSMPLKVYDLLNSIEMIRQGIQRRRKKRREAAKNRSPEQKAVITEAKALLMERNHMTEEEAHRYLQKSSMDSGTNMLETAQMVLTVMSESV